MTLVEAVAAIVVLPLLLAVPGLLLLIPSSLALMRKTEDDAVIGVVFGTGFLIAGLAVGIGFLAQLS